VTSAHFIFIPAVLAVGLFIGFLLGARVAQDRINLEIKRQAEREETRRQRAARKASRATAASGEVASVASMASMASMASIPVTEADTVKPRKTPPR
jgi:Na+/glutamate symporter